VVKEMEEIKDLGYKEVFFRDETFTANKIRLIKICKLILERKLEISWICNARIGNLDKKIMKLMEKAGCHYIKFGVESGVQKILDNIKKDIDAKMTRKTFKWANEIGMGTHAHLMFGCIGETKESIEKTIQFIKEINPTTITANIFTPFPGSEVFEMVKKVSPEIGDGTNCDLSKIHTTGFFNEVFSDVNGKELEESIKRIYREFYFRPSYILRRLSSIDSLNEFRRSLLAGLDIVSFSFLNED